MTIPTGPKLDATDELLPVDAELVKDLDVPDTADVLGGVCAPKTCHTTKETD